MAKNVSQHPQGPFRIGAGQTVSKSQCHADVARLESQPRVESLGIDAGVMREQLDQFALPCARLGEGPLHQLLADTAAAAMRGDANVLDQAARGALRAYSRQDAELQAADYGAVSVLRYHKPDIRIAVERLKRLEIARRQRVFEP